MKKQIIALIVAATTIFVQQLRSDEITDKIMGNAYTESNSEVLLKRICTETGGRLPGTQANIKTIEILKEELAKYGIESHSEKFQAPCFFRGEDRVDIVLPLQKKLNVAALGYVDSVPIFTSTIVFVKHGSSKDYDSISVRGKAVITSLEAETGSDRLMRCEAIEMAARYGAKAIFFINEKSGNLLLASVANFLGKPSAIPAFSISLEDGKHLLNLLELNNKEIKDSVKIRIETHSHFKVTETENLVSSFPGRTGKRIVIGAHVDSWDISQGTVDNGYGTVAIFEVARILKKYSFTNNCAIDFVWFNGEELGLWGSKEYIKKHEKDSITAVFNYDMPGITTGFNLMGFQEFEPFFKKIISSIKGCNFTAGITNQPWLGSDHISFMMHGIPSFTTQGYLEKDMYYYYHDAGDTYDKANFQFITDCAAVAAVVTRELARGEGYPLIRYTDVEMKSLFEKYKLDVKLKKLGDWKYDK